MAEGFARMYGSDCLVAASAGMAPASIVAKDTMRAMNEKNIDLSDHFPKGLKYLERATFDLVVNMSGLYLTPKFGTAKMLEWDVTDPVALDYDEHCAVRDEIERRVMMLILELRREPETKLHGLGVRRDPV